MERVQFVRQLLLRLSCLVAAALAFVPLSGSPASAQTPAQVESIRKNLEQFCPAKIDFKVFVSNSGTMYIDGQHHVSSATRYCAGNSEAQAIANYESCTNNPNIALAKCVLYWPAILQKDSILQSCKPSVSTFKKSKIIKFLGLFKTAEKDIDITMTTYTCNRADVFPSCTGTFGGMSVDLFRKADITDFEKLVQIGMSGCIVDEAAEAKRQAAVEGKRLLLSGLLDARGGLLGKQCNGDAGCEKRVADNWRKVTWHGHALMGQWDYDDDQVKIMKEINELYSFEKISGTKGIYVDVANSSHQFLDSALALRQGILAKQYCKDAAGPCIAAVNKVWGVAASEAHYRVQHYPLYANHVEVMKTINAKFEPKVAAAASAASEAQKQKGNLDAILVLKKEIWSKGCPAAPHPKAGECADIVNYFSDGISKAAHNQIDKPPYNGNAFEVMKALTKTYDPMVNKALAPFKS